mgnify:CR=1 FL=1
MKIEISNKMIEELKYMGLTENEAKVYLALIDLGPSLVGQISRKLDCIEELFMMLLKCWLKKEW